ncbi:MAG: type II secretion system F family protein, partial [Candidatus Altiarchaeota archaeon]
EDEMKQARPPLVEKLMPKKFIENYRKAVSYSSVEIDPDQFLNLIAMVGGVISIIVAAILNSYLKYNIVLVFIVSLVAYAVATYILLQLSAESKAKFVESVLPDALQLMASNIRAGLTTDKALLLAARPEFGPLREEISKVGRETMAGRNFIDALKKSTLKIRSKDMERTIALIVQSLKSGGQLADLLDQTADDMRDQQIIQKEISASVLMYAMFIGIAITLGAPMLFALSSFLLELLVKNMELISSQMPMSLRTMASSVMPAMAGSGITIKPEFARTYSVISIIVSTIFGSLVMGLIMKGEEKAGLKYIPPMMVVAICLFYLIHYILTTVLSGMMGV